MCRSNILDGSLGLLDTESDGNQCMHELGEDLELCVCADSCCFCVEQTILHFLTRILENCCVETCLLQTTVIINPQNAVVIFFLLQLPWSQSLLPTSLGTQFGSCRSVACIFPPPICLCSLFNLYWIMVLNMGIGLSVSMGVPIGAICIFGLFAFWAGQ